MGKDEKVNIKDRITILLNDIMDNSNIILKHTSDKKITTKLLILIEDIENIILWYKTVKKTAHVLDYMRDYHIMDSRFNHIVDLLPSKFYYGICLITHKLKVTVTK